MFSFAESYTPDEAVAVLKAMMRVLLFRSPWFAEIAWVSSEHLKSAPADRWVEIRAPYGTSYIWHGSDGAGKSSLTRTNVPDSDIVLVQQNAAESRELRERYRWMLRWLGNHEARPFFEERIALLDEMATSEFAWPHLASFLGNCQTDLRNAAIDAVAQTKVIPFERQVMYDFRSHFLQLRFPGYLLAFLRLLHLSWRDVTAIILREKGDSDLKFGSIDDFVFHVFDVVVERKGPESIERAATELHDEGRATLDLAKGMGEPESYFDWVFGAGYLFYGASVAYDYLSRDEKLGSELCESCRRQSNVCNEIETTCWAAELHWLMDRITKGFYFERCRERVDRARGQGGEAAACLEADDVIGNALLYPKSYRAALLQPLDRR